MTACTTFLRWLLLYLALAIAAPAAYAAASGAGEVEEKDIPLKVAEVAPGLFFQYHHQESNNAFIVTNEGVLVIDTRQHPRRAEKYKDVRNYYRMNLFIASYYHFLTTGKAENAYP